MPRGRGVWADGWLMELGQVDMIGQCLGWVMDVTGGY